MSDDRTPVLVGVGQLLQRDVDVDLANAPSPLDMLEAVARTAADDAGIGARIWDVLDTVALVSFFGGRPPAGETQNAPRALADRLGAKPTGEFNSELGGQIGVTLANFAARRIAVGESQVALVAGCNNMRTLSLAHQRNVSLDWRVGGSGTPEQIGQNKPGTNSVEEDYGMRMPTDIYPLFENALRARQGHNIETHRARMGALFSPFTEVAATNPYAWFPTVRSAEELTTVTPQNRMIAYPYPKYLNAVLAVDQAAAFLLLSAGQARQLGISEDQFVYWWGGAEANEEAWWASERPDLARCPAMLDSTEGALESAGLEIGDIDRFDFYSCFPSAVAMACQMLGLEQDDPRGFTVTGGLPYAGGPASAYTLHSIATLAQELRAGRGTKGLVTGNGWYLTKHAASVWSSEPRPDGPGVASLAGPRPSAALHIAPAPVVRDAEGDGTCEAYTVLYDREGAPERGIVLGRLEDGRRFLANTPGDRALLEAFVLVEEVGRRGRVAQRDGRTIFDPA